MPPVPSPALILVTGGSGFIGSWVIRTLLANNYAVRATVRTPEKGKFLTNLFAVDYPGQFHFVVVPNIEIEGAFDACVEGVEGVQHIASPLTGDPNAVISVAVNGTLSLLKSIANHGKDVGRVILTSSAAALLEPKTLPCVYTETDWNQQALTVGPDATPIQKYYASKTLAEKAAWDFVHNQVFDLVTILPPLVIGPMIHQVESKDTLSYSLSEFFSGILKTKPPGATFGNWADVRDIAEAHVLALREERASGQRIIISAGPASWQLIYDTLNSTQPRLPDIPLGNPGDINSGMPQWTFKVDLASALGLHYKPLAESLRDTVISMREQPWEYSARR